MTLPRLPLHDAQIPAPGLLHVDHVAHFVPDRDAAAVALARMGFTLTPFSEQSHRLEPGGPLLPAGTGNRCAMLRAGYLEFLTPFADTPVAQQLRAAIARYTGVHLVAFGTADAEADYARLARAGYRPDVPVRLQREADAPGGAVEVRFSVTRTPPGTMAEGRIQFCQHHTPEGVWQLRWLRHANRATALTTVFVVSADPREAAERYARYTGLPATPHGDGWRLATARGALLFTSAAAAQTLFGLAPPSLPWIAGYALATEDPAATRRVLDDAGIALRELGRGRCAAICPAEIGGVVVFEPEGAPTLPPPV